MYALHRALFRGTAQVTIYDFRHQPNENRLLSERLGKIILRI